MARGRYAFVEVGGWRENNGKQEDDLSERRNTLDRFWKYRRANIRAYHYRARSHNCNLISAVEVRSARDIEVETIRLCAALRKDYANAFNSLIKVRKYTVAL